ncbi:60S ribosomal protein L23 [Hordeum vulgare]|nr:60S ribosomal protein L23 [Hordeum vulgare]
MADGGDGEGAGESCWLAPAAAASVHGGGGDGVLLYDVRREIYDRLRAVGNQEALADPFFDRVLEDHY